MTLRLPSFSLWRTALARLGAGTNAVTIHGRTRFAVPHGSLVGAGRLSVGFSWPGELARPTLFRIETGGRCRCEGAFRIGDGCKVIVRNGARLTLGSGYINTGSSIDCSSEISIGTDVAIGSNVSILDNDFHRIDGERPPALPIAIGDHVWIGLGAIVLKGVEIGNGAVIGAGSVVTRSIPAGMLAAGSPARVIRPVSWS